MEKQDKKSLVQSLTIPFYIVLVMWGVYFLNVSFGLGLNQYGIYPRHISGLKGILFSPFLHDTSGFSHIINNTPPIFILTWALFYFYRKIAPQIWGLSWLVGGLFVWIGGRDDSVHVGMSGIIYSLAFFLFFSGIFRKEVKLVAISLFVVFLYGGMIWGIFPIDISVSFESHLYGAVVGVVLAYFYKEEGATFKKKKYQWEIDEEREKELLKQGYTKVESEEGFLIRYEYKENKKEHENE